MRTRSFTPTNGSPPCVPLCQIRENRGSDITAAIAVPVAADGTICKGQNCIRVFKKNLTADLNQIYSCRDMIIDSHHMDLTASYSASQRRKMTNSEISSEKEGGLILSLNTSESVRD